MRMRRSVISPQARMAAANARRMQGAAAPEMPSAPPPVKLMKKGGYTKAADGCAQRGKTRGTMVMCGGGMMKK